MSIFSQKKVSVCVKVLLFLLLLLIAGDIDASQDVIRLDYQALPYSLLSQGTHDRDSFILADISTPHPFEGELYARIASRGVEAPSVTKSDRDVKTLNFRNILDANSAYDTLDGNFLYQEAYHMAHVEVDDINILNTHRYETLMDGTKYMVFMHVATAGILYLMPESVTKWDKSTMSFSTVTDKWVDNVTSGPVWDGDDWLLNYVGHPYQGAAYYVVARKSGFGWKGAFIYSAVCSSFMWEYGFESFAERPSLQDLIVTPVAGALLGELFLHGEKRIMRNGGTVMGSKFLGNISLVLLDPAGSLIRSMKGWFDWPSRIEAHTEYFAAPLLVPDHADPLDQLDTFDNHLGMKLVFSYD